MSQFRTEITDDDGKVIGVVKTEQPLTAAEIATLRADMLEGDHDPEAVLTAPDEFDGTKYDPENDPDFDPATMQDTVVTELFTRRKKRRVRMEIKTTEHQAEMWDPDFDLSQLDDEELVRGRRRADDGSFRGRAPKAIPGDFYRRAMRELFARADRTLQINLTKATEQMAAIAMDPAVDPSVRLKASQWIIERVMGKTPERVEVTTSDPWDNAISGVLVQADEDAAILRAQGVLDSDNAKEVDVEGAVE